MEQTLTTARPVRAAAAERAEGAAQIDRSQADWYKDAIIYQLHVKAFHDANDDGIGDFAGLIAAARLRPGARRHGDLADAVLPLAAARRRLRHRGLPLDQPVLRDAWRTSRRSSRRRTGAGSG